MGSNFSVRYRHLDLKSNPHFRDLSEEYRGNLRAWYSYNYRLNHKQQETKVPKALTTNLLLAGLFRDDEVDSRLGNYLASILERFADKKVLAKIASDHVRRAVKLIDDINDAKKVNLTVGSLWPPIQLRAVAEVLRTGIRNNPNDRLLYQAWFNGCIVPAL
jgi:hypothetical protein